MSSGSAGIWRMDVTSAPPVDCKIRGVDDPAILPNYPYRDDAIAGYKAIHTYVASVVNHFYGQSKSTLFCFRHRKVGG